MAEPIRIRIRGSDSETDAPTIEDFIEQVRDLFTILHEVEKAIDPAHKGGAIEWRITKATTNSPIAIEATPFGRDHATYVEPRAREVLRHTAAGLNQLKIGTERPTYFTEAVLTRAKSISKRVTNGLALTEVEFGDGTPDFVLTPQPAALMVANTETVLAPPKARPYREAGSIEGFIGGVSHDGHGRTIMTMQARITGEEVKCILRGDANRIVRERQVGEVIDGKRVRVIGTLLYRGPRRIDHVEGHRIEFLRGEKELPTLEDITDPDFTGGLSSEEYLEALRDGRLN